MNLPYDVVERGCIAGGMGASPNRAESPPLRKSLIYPPGFHSRSTASGRLSNAKAAEEASYEEYKKNLRRNAKTSLHY